MSRGVHVNVSGPGLPGKGGHVTFVPDVENNRLNLEPADPATKKLTEALWKKTQLSVKKYMNNPQNVDRMSKAAQSGLDYNPNSHRAGSIRQTKAILDSHKNSRTNPCL